MTKQYAIDMAKKLFRENEKAYYVIFFAEENEYKLADAEEFNQNRAQWNRNVVFSIEAE